MAKATAQAPATRGEKIPAWVKEEWQTAYLRVKGATVAQWLWHRVLTKEEQQRLGGDLEAALTRHGGAFGMWRQLRGVSFPQAVVAVAVRLNLLDAGTGQALLRALGEEPDDPAEALEAAVTAGGLVVAEAPRQAFWDGEPIEIDWAVHTSLWELLWALARKSKAGAVVDAAALQDREEGDPKFVTKRKCRLVNRAGFPLSLADRVVSAGRGSYKLDLPPARIRVFESVAGDAAREWTP
jgi:hypothetical protein